MSERVRIATDPKIAWAMALDTGVRSQMGPILEELHMGGAIQYSTRGGAGAAHGADYAPIYGRILLMEREEPGLAAVGHVLCHPDTEKANGWLDAAAAVVESRAIAAILNWGDGRAWRPAKKERASYLVRVALIERQRNLSNAMPAWSAERIGAVMADWYGMPITTRDWARDWLPTWAAIQAAIHALEADAMEPISEIIGDMVQRCRRAA